MSMIKPLQTTSFPRIGAQQATAMQSTTLPATTDNGLNISELMNLMITMMIVVMMMKMMMTAMAGAM